MCVWLQLYRSSPKWALPFAEYLLLSEVLLPQRDLLLVEYLSDGDGEREQGIGVWSQENVCSQILKTGVPVGLCVASWLPDQGTRCS